MATAILRVVPPEDVKPLINDPVDELTRGQSAAIVDQVRSEGEAGLISIAQKFGDIEAGQPHIIDRAALKASFDALPQDQQELLQRVAERVHKFATAQRAAISDVSIAVPGGKVAPVETAGCYAPGGRVSVNLRIQILQQLINVLPQYPLPSSVIMTAVTARVAGVEKVWVASPRPAAVTLAAAYVSGADALLAVGGAQAIAAMAYGVGGVPACDVIVGPGNRWVTAAKAIVSGRCAIDMLAGPSECLVLADDTANPKTVAADLLAQAEHDTDALPILVSTSAALIDQVNAELEAQLAVLPTAETARVSTAKGYSVLCPDMDTAIHCADVIAPEHLEVLVADADGVSARLKHYGGLFIGSHAAEVFGDYGAGPNHVLPTSGTARYTGGLSVFTFLRIRTWLRADAGADGVPTDLAGMKQLVDDSAALARLEGLEGHARSAEARRQS